MITLQKGSTIPMSVDDNWFSFLHIVRQASWRSGFMVFQKAMRSLSVLPAWVTSALIVSISALLIAAKAGPAKAAESTATSAICMSFIGLYPYLVSDRPAGAKSTVFNAG